MSRLDTAIYGVVGDLLANLGVTTPGGVTGPGLTTDAVLKLQPQGYDPRSGNEVTSTAQTWNLNVTPPEPFKVSQVNMTSVKQGDFLVSVAAKQLNDLGAPAPDVKMSLQIQSIWYSIVAVDPVLVGNTAVLYTLHCRR